MVIFLLQTVIVLCYGTLPVDGQYTFSSIKCGSGSGFDENVLNILMELDQKLTTPQLKASSLDKCKTVEPLSIATELNENYQNLKMTFQNLSDKFDRIDGKFQDTNECLRTEIQGKNSKIGNQSMLSRVEKIGKGNQALNERLETSRMELHQIMASTLHNISYGSEQRDAKLDELLKMVQEHKLQLDNMTNNLVARLDKIEERVTAAETKNADLVNKLEAVEHEISGREMERKLQKMQENVSEAFDKVNDKLNTVLYQANESRQDTKSLDHCRGNPRLCDCSSIRANGFRTSGVYRVYVEHQYQIHYFDVYCDMTTLSASWTVFQRRKDGREDFYRGWNEYANGFGNPQGEFWLGNDFLHYVTSKRRYKLRIELEEFGGAKGYAEYSVFNISSAAEKYKLTIGAFAGTVGDSLIYHNGHKFSTKDQDNDGASENCAATRHGAWWYDYCHYSNLNGLYYSYGNHSTTRSHSGNGIEWYHWRTRFGISLKTTEMKLSPY